MNSNRFSNFVIIFKLSNDVEPKKWSDRAHLTPLHRKIKVFFSVVEKKNWQNTSFL